MLIHTDTHIQLHGYIHIQVHLKHVIYLGHSTFGLIEEQLWNSLWDLAPSQMFKGHIFVMGNLYSMFILVYWKKVYGGMTHLVSYLNKGNTFLRKWPSFLISDLSTLPNKSIHFCILGRWVWLVEMYLALRDTTSWFLHSNRRWNSSPMRFSFGQREQNLRFLEVFVYLPTTLGNQELLVLIAHTALFSDEGRWTR